MRKGIVRLSSRKDSMEMMGGGVACVDDSLNSKRLESQECKSVYGKGLAAGRSLTSLEILVR